VAEEESRLMFALLDHPEGRNRALGPHTPGVFRMNVKGKGLLEKDVVS